jgi:KaiC/GvpD/RAD55 family RecA-like ATPase
MEAADAASAMTADRVGERPVEDARYSHLLQLYQDETFLCDVVADFMIGGLQHHEQLVVIAIEAHREQLASALESRAWDVEGALLSGRLVMRDARDMLGRLLVDGQLQQHHLLDHLRELLDDCRLADSQKRARVYAEMAGLFWEESAREACEQLEAAWTKLAGSHRFTLLCSYRVLLGQGATQATSSTRLCNLHTHILPSEHCLGRGRVEERLRHLFMLEQHTRELEEALAVATRSEALLNGTIELLRARLASAAEIVRDAVPEWTDDLETVRKHVVDGNVPASLSLLARMSHRANTLRNTLMLALDKRAPARRERS